MKTLRRANDNGGNEYKNRKFFNLDWNNTIKLAFVIIAFLGGGTTSELISSKEEVTKVDTKLESYIDRHKAEEELQERIIQNEIKNITEKLDDLKADIREVKRLIQKK